MEKKECIDDMVRAKPYKNALNVETGEFVYGELSQHKHGTYIKVSDNTEYLIYPESVGFSTRISDVDHDRLFSDDIIEFTDNFLNGYFFIRKNIDGFTLSNFEKEFPFDLALGHKVKKVGNLFENEYLFKP